MHDMPMKSMMEAFARQKGSYFLVKLLIILLSYQGILANESHGTTTAPSPPTKCIVCDSQREPACANDTTLTSAMEMECEEGQTWCYKSEGKVTVLEYNKEHHAEKEEIEKVERGCTKIHDKPLCIRVKQNGGRTANFRVCLCDSEFCNKNFDVYKNVTFLNKNAAPQTKNEISGRILLAVMLTFIQTLR